MPRGGEEYGAWFDHEAAEKACAFFPRYLRHTEGEWAGKPFHLQAWEADAIVRPVFGWKRADGTRLVRFVWVEVARKNGKSELAAGVSLLCLVGDGEFGGQGYAYAVDKDQAKVVHGKAATMVGMSPELSDVVEVFKTALWVPELHASFKPLSSGAANKHGFSPSFAVGDEAHEYVDGELVDVVHKGMGARRQPLEFMITSAGVKRKGSYAWEMHQHALQIRDGVIVDPTFLPVLYGADGDDDWTDEAVWAKANPNLGISIKREFLKTECERAKHSPRLENAFKRFHLNMWTEQTTRWLPLEAWGRCSAAPRDAERWRKLEAELAGRRCFAGLDLASTRDITALVLVFPPETEGDRWVFLWRFWVPDEQVDVRAEQDRVPYDQWARDGALFTTPGNVTDYRAIKEQIYRDGERFIIAEIAIDRWNATQLAVELQEDGLTVAMFGQGYASMSAPAKEFEKLVVGAGLEHGNHPVARWMASHVEVSQDAAGNIKPDKARSSEKIDGIVAGVMGLGRANAHQDEMKEITQGFIAL